MKRFLASVILLNLSLFSSSAPAADSAKSVNATPEDCIRNFYGWYVTELEANRDPRKQKTKMKQYVTERLLKEVAEKEKGPDGMDWDYFIAAQDFDPLWATNISISGVQNQGDKSNAHVWLKGSKSMEVKLIVHLVKQSGSWRVDKVEDREGGD